MLRRDFFRVVGSFAAATAAARSAVVAAGVPEAAVDQCVACRINAPPSAADALLARYTLERAVIDCIRDRSLRCLGVTAVSGEYQATYVPSDDDRETPERDRSDALVGLYDRRVIAMRSIDVINGYDGIVVHFSICPAESSSCR